MLANVNPERDPFGESMSTLKFARRVSTVELGARMNKETSEVMQLKEQGAGSVDLAKMRSRLLCKESALFVLILERPTCLFKA